MSIFKKKIDFSQFIANLILFHLGSIEKNFDRMVFLADEFKVLTESDKIDLYEKLQTLLVTDILFGCQENFGDNLTPEEINKYNAVMYLRYLVEYKKLQEKEAINKVNKVLELINYIEDAKNDDERRGSESNKNGYEKKIFNDQDEKKFLLCSGFAIYFAGKFTGKNVHDENHQGRHFAAFKLAKAFVKADIVNNYAKECKITLD